jgi:hypothetical protein
MNYRRGFQRVYAILAVAWVVAILLTQPHDRLKFWQATPIPTFEEFQKSFPAPPEVKFDANSAVVWDSDWKVLQPQPASRTQKILWLAQILLIPPVFGYLIAFFSSLGFIAASGQSSRFSALPGATLCRPR